MTRPRTLLIVGLLAALVAIPLVALVAAPGLFLPAIAQRFGMERRAAAKWVVALKANDMALKREAAKFAADTGLISSQTNLFDGEHEMSDIVISGPSFGRLTLNNSPRPRVYSLYYYPNSKADLDASVERIEAFLARTGEPVSFEDFRQRSASR